MQNSLIVVKNRKINIIKNILKNVLKICIVAVFPIILFLAIELLNGMEFKDIMIHIKTKSINILVIVALLAGMYALIGKIKKAMIATTIIAMGLAIVNYFLVEIRGTSITPADFYSISMVGKMANVIKIRLSSRIFMAIGIIIIWSIICSKIKFRGTSGIKNKIIRTISVIGCMSVFIVFFTTDLLDVRMTYNTNQFYNENGVLVSFLETVKEMKVTKPEGYSTEIIENQLNELLGETKDITIDENMNKPNIIVIMNESLTDLSEIYNIKMSEDNMSFIHSLTENTIKGNVHTSSIGGKTANCEWEFLTGNSTRFLPTGAVPYQQYIKKSTTSLVSVLNSNGYTTTAFHPYNKEGYSRNVIYPLLGFKEAKFNDTMENINYIRYGDYADDLSTYKNIVSLFENKEKEEKIFNFTVTMQNHLSYDDKNFKNTVFLSGRDKEKYSEVNQYLSLVKLSDEAFEYLVNYFKNYDEPTIIMMFGDHQPALVNWYEEIFGQREEEYNEKKYIVPMVMWANYDIKEQNIKDTSMNYLSNLLLENAGIEKTDYIRYLDNLYEKYPVITVNTYQNNKGKFYEYEEEIPEDLKLYEYIQYNNMFDDNKLNIYNRDTKE